jgi:hypothetical protein
VSDEEARKQEKHGHAELLGPFDNVKPENRTVPEKHHEGGAKSQAVKHDVRVILAGS